MLEMWKMKNVTLFSLDEQQSNGPFYLLLSDRFTTFTPGIYAIAPNRQIYIKLCSWNMGQMIQSCVHLLCLVYKKNGSPVIKGKANKKEATRRVERFDRSIVALTRCSKKSSFFDSSQFKSSESPLTKKHFSRSHCKIVITSYLLPTHIVWWTNRFTKPNFQVARITNRTPDSDSTCFASFSLGGDFYWCGLVRLRGTTESEWWRSTANLRHGGTDGPTNRLATKDRPAKPLLWCNSAILDRPPGFRMCWNFIF